MHLTVEQQFLSAPLFRVDFLGFLPHISCHSRREIEGTVIAALDIYKANSQTKPQRRTCAANTSSFTLVDFCCN